MIDPTLKDNWTLFPYDMDIPQIHIKRHAYVCPRTVKDSALRLEVLGCVIRGFTIPIWYLMVGVRATNASGNGNLCLKFGVKEAPRHIWRGVRQLLGGGETHFNSFLCEDFGQFIEGA